MEKTHTTRGDGKAYTVVKGTFLCKQINIGRNSVFCYSPWHLLYPHTQYLSFFCLYLNHSLWSTERERDYWNSFIQSLTVAVYQTFQYMQTLLLKCTEQPTEEHQTHALTACDPNICTWPCSDANLAHLIPTHAHFHFNTLSVLLSLLCGVSVFVSQTDCTGSKGKDGKSQRRTDSKEEEKKKNSEKKGGGGRLGSATQMLFASSISELQAMCVCVCVSFLFLNHCTEADCFILFQQVPLTAQVHTRKLFECVCPWTSV